MVAMLKEKAGGQVASEAAAHSINALSLASVVGAAAHQFLVDLHRRFDAERLRLLAARQVRQQRYDAGMLPDWRDDTRGLRESDWSVAAPPTALRDRRVEITGPTDAKTIINALNSGACVFMADFEDSTSPTLDNLLAGQLALSQAIDGTLEFDAPATGKLYQLRPDRDDLATLRVRPRGWHLAEAHFEVDGAAMSAALFDAGLFLKRNAAALARGDRGPFLYLPKIECMEEAALWDAVLAHCEHELELAPGTIKVTVLIETLPAAFEMDEILHALRTRIAGLNCGRWDYVFSYLKTFRAHGERVLPERGQVTMTQPFLRAYSELLIRTCHRRGAHAMGGMAAQIPIARDEAANAAALARVRADKDREAKAGHDGTWVAHPGLIALAREAFDAVMPGTDQKHVARDDVAVSRDDLIAPSPGTITRAGFDNNIEVCVRYLAAWLDGQGCVPIHHLMEDAATAEIARAQVWQWLRHAAHLEDGAHIDLVLFAASLEHTGARLQQQPDLPGHAHLGVATQLLDRLTRADTLADFLTLAAYPLIVASNASDPNPVATSETRSNP